jgi:hypothetical protein
MRLKKEPEDRLAESVKMAGAATAGATGLKGALNAILSGKAGAVAKMLPRALGKSAGAGAIGAAIAPEELSSGSTEAERKLEMGEPLSDKDYAELEAMKYDASRALRKVPTPEERKADRNLLNKWVIGKQIDDEMRAEEAQNEAQEEPMDEIPQEDDGGIDPEEARRMNIDELLKKLRMHNI